MIGLFWLIILGVMVGIPEHRLRTGREMLLKTAPIDPWDFFRGDYVVLLLNGREVTFSANAAAAGGNMRSIFRCSRGAYDRGTQTRGRG